MDDTMRRSIPEENTESIVGIVVLEEFWPWGYVLQTGITDTFIHKYGSFVEREY